MNERPMNDLTKMTTWTLLHKLEELIAPYLEAHPEIEAQFRPIRGAIYERDRKYLTLLIEQAEYQQKRDLHQAQIDRVLRKLKD